MKGERDTKNAPGLLEAKECVRFQFLEHQKEYNIQRAYKTLRILRSGFMTIYIGERVAVL